MKACPSCGTSNQDLAPSCESCGTAFGTLHPSWRGGAPASELATTVSNEPDLIAGRYRLIEQLGKGGAGVVYRAWDTKLEEDTAIKILQQDANADGAEIARFKREIKTARTITHPNVIRIHDFGESGKDVFISMEILKGGTLGRRMKEGLSLGEGLTIAIGVCDGVQAAHALDIVHRDLKPDNILFDSSGRPKVVDFGLARLQMASTRTVGFSGTPFYMSPEHANGQEVTTRSDVYSLGIVLYQLFTGRLPFTADNFLRLVTMHCSEVPPSVRSLAPDLPVELERVIHKSLEKDPKKRHANAGELAADLRRVAARVGANASTLIRTNTDVAPSLRMAGPVPMPVRELAPPRRSAGRRALVAMGFLGVAAAAAFGVSEVLQLPPAATPTPTPVAVAAPSLTAPVASTPVTDATAAPVETVAPATPVETIAPATLTPAPAAPTPAPATPTPARTKVAVRPTPARTPPPATPTPAPVVAGSLLKVTGNGYVEVYVNNVKVGVAPHEETVKAGTILVKVVAPGPPTRVKTRSLTVESGMRYDLFFDVEKNDLALKAQKR